MPQLPGSGQSMVPDNNDPFPDKHNSTAPVPSIWLDVANFLKEVALIWAINPTEAERLRKDANETYKRIQHPMFPFDKNMKEPDLKAKMVPLSGN